MDAYDDFRLARQASGLANRDFDDNIMFMDQFTTSPRYLSPPHAGSDVEVMVKLEDVAPNPPWISIADVTPPISISTVESQPTDTPRNGSPKITAAVSTSRRPTTSVTKTTTRKSSACSAVSTDPGAAHEVGKEKNRIAAGKCRRKKKVEEKQLEERRRTLEAQHSVLVNTASALKSEVLFLKHEILKHAACSFKPIESYIENAASRMT